MKDKITTKELTLNLRLGDYVQIKDAARIQNMNLMSHIKDQLGEPPYIVLENAAFTSSFGLEVFVRSRDQVRHPVRVLRGESGSHDNTPNLYENGAIQIPVSFLEKVAPPLPEFIPGRLVRIKADVVRNAFPQFQSEGIIGKYGDKICKVLRIIEADDLNEPALRKYFAMIALKDSTDTDSIHSVPIEALETIH
jgi:hypothetical protein